MTSGGGGQLLTTSKVLNNCPPPPDVMTSDLQPHGPNIRIRNHQLLIVCCATRPLSHGLIQLQCMVEVHQCFIDVALAMLDGSNQVIQGCLLMDWIIRIRSLNQTPSL